MISSTSIDPFKSVVTVRRNFISFHQNNDIVHFRSFAGITYARHGNEFLPLNFDRETSNNFNNCMKHKRWRQYHSFITREIKKTQLNTILLVAADKSKANFRRLLWVSQMKTHYEARIYFAHKPWIVVFNVVEVTKYLS